ncbi:DNA-binding transcriptional activator FucR [Raoultella planticola]|uniref:DNA-binding transcriptional activator FucR n=1 Tax=Raoultella planticola TaxID=575 RepID=A0A485CWB5_RAOPL|nr:DNA-binding transcriptional activator FucR [Raoultella planticola]
MRLGRKALQLLQPGDTILLDSSSTSWFMARQIPEMALTVITPSVAILQALDEPSLLTPDLV